YTHWKRRDEKPNMNPREVSWLCRRVRPYTPLLAAMAGLILIAAWAAVAQISRSVSDGVYTEEQANRGKTAYAEQCAKCHGAELRGGDETPAVVGDAFLAKWRDRSVDELFESIRVSMPVDRPGSLSRQKYTDILAYIFAANKFPAGGAELSSQSETLKQIKLQARATPGPQSQAAPTGGAPAGTASRSNSRPL